MCENCHEATGASCYPPEPNRLSLEGACCETLGLKPPQSVCLGSSKTININDEEGEGIYT